MATKESQENHTKLIQKARDKRAARGLEVIVHYNRNLNPSGSGLSDLLADLICQCSAAGLNFNEEIIHARVVIGQY